MDASGAHQMGSSFLIEAFQIGDVLEIVGVDLAALHHLVGHDIIGELRHLQRPALLSQKGSRSGKDLRVRHAGGRHSDGSFGLCGLGFRRIALSRLCFGSAGLSRGALLHAFRFCGRRLRSRRAFCGSRALRARSLCRVRAAARQQAGGQKRRCDQ